MVGRGVDQALAHPSEPTLCEAGARDARDFIALAQDANGPLDLPLSYGSIWGEALDLIDRAAPDLRIVNLETAVTTSDEAWPEKPVHFRMHPKNVPAITVAKIDCCTLANNHVLDWGHAGLEQTLDVLAAERIQTAGAGLDDEEAARPAVFDLGQGRRVLVFATSHHSGGAWPAFAAGPGLPGMHRLEDVSKRTLRAVVAWIQGHARPDDVVIFSIHWGGNWGWEVRKDHRRFARWLVKHAGVDVVYSHSSHHVRPMEVYRDRLILYGCGDLINDYEGVYFESLCQYRPDLTLLYFLELEAGTGRLVGLRMAPLQIHRLSLRRAAPDDAAWLRDMFAREGRRYRLKSPKVRLDGGELVASWR